MIYSLGGYKRNKPTPDDHESNFKKVGAILSKLAFSFLLIFLNKIKNDRTFIFSLIFCRRLGLVHKLY